MRPLNHRDDKRFDDVLHLKMFTQTRGCAVGVGGLVMTTLDGQENWVSAEHTDTTEDLFDCAFSDKMHGWAVGDNCTVIHSSDAGRTWHVQSSGRTVRLYGVMFADSERGAVIGENGVLLVTTTGGATWTLHAPTGPRS